MLKVWQKKLLLNVPERVFEYLGGDITQIIEHTFDAGFYNILLCGGGGGGCALYGTDWHYPFRFRADGGVGGVLRVKIKVPTKTTATLTVAGKATSRYSGFATSGVTSAGDNGTATSIIGLPDLVLNAGGGTNATITSSSNHTANRTAGVQGANTATGTNLIQILENNVQEIISRTLASDYDRTDYGQPNTNSPNPETIGNGGGVGEINSISQLLSGGYGYIRIERI